jgi:hypothetical protein
MEIYGFTYAIDVNTSRAPEEGAHSPSGPNGRITAPGGDRRRRYDQAMQVIQCSDWTPQATYDVLTVYLVYLTLTKWTARKPERL